LEDDSKIEEWITKKLPKQKYIVPIHTPRNSSSAEAINQEHDLIPEEIYKMLGSDFEEESTDEESTQETFTVNVDGPSSSHYRTGSKYQKW
jgi:hypothetical protein